MKKLLGLSIGLLVAGVNAEVIELNATDLEVCHKQLAAAKAHAPIILEYMQDCPFYKHFLPVYEQAATDHSQLSFYKVDVEKLTDEVKDQCLGEGSAYVPVSPKVTVNAYFAEDGKGKIIQLRSDVGSLRAPFSAEELTYLLRNVENPPEVTLHHSLVK